MDMDFSQFDDADQTARIPMEVQVASNEINQTPSNRLPSEELSVETRAPFAILERQHNSAASNYSGAYFKNNIKC